VRRAFVICGWVLGRECARCKGDGVGRCLQEEQDGDPAAEAEHGRLMCCGCDCGCVYVGTLACARCSPNGPDVSRSVV